MLLFTRSSNVELTDAHPNTTLWAFSRNTHDPVHDQLWVIPDCTFWAHPRVAGSFADFQHRALQYGRDFGGKISKLVWRGVMSVNRELRNALLEQCKGKSWSDVAAVSEDADDMTGHIAIEDHCRYKYAVHTEGTTWSSRLKFLLSCNSVVLVQPLKYTTHLYHLLNAEGPEQNYVPVSSDWTNLPEKVEALEADSEQAESIARNAASLFRDRYATPAAQTCYFRRLFRTWREVSFEPEPYELVRSADGVEMKTIRGMTYEEYM